ncbi:hypothetical protein [Paraflavitalea speifideaquila]|uniref:gliding motility lipoprotein GldB n=1 Tax=Paraflavitalea speifideaquila TaxID=3076558 RepID=UPI0028E3274E|nr:hypothetical protein [Paraflavitalea speifideiaquila]
MPSLQKLGQQYPHFMTDYFQNILGLPPFSSDGDQATQLVKQFLRDYKPIQAAVSKTFPDTRSIEKEVKKGLQFVKYYFPEYKAPTRLIFYIGPMDALYQASLGSYGDAITNNGLAVGLQLHLGKDFELYTSEMGRALYPAYISRRFTPEYIPVNCIKNVIDDIYPEKTMGKTLVEQMVEKGKRMYVLDKLMPGTPDTLKIGYTDRQLKGCFANEGKIWNFFLVNSLLMNNEPAILKNYMSDAPFTQELGEGSPGYIGLFTGWQMVKKYMDKHPVIKLSALLNIPPMDIYQQSKYKPG